MADGRVNSAIFSLGTIMQEAIIWICVDQDLRCHIYLLCDWEE